MDAKITQRIFDIIMAEVGIDISKFDFKKNFREQISLDSMQFVTIIAKIEEVFTIELPISIMEITTLEEFFSIINQQLMK